MSSVELLLDDKEKKYLRDLAISSIKYGAEHGKILPLDISEVPDKLRCIKATFVTLKKFGELRGCVGVINATRPLALDVVHNAYSSAFEDTRFAELSSGELSDLSVSISILSDPEEIKFRTEPELLSKLRPGVDGVIIKTHVGSATFLPVMWKEIDSPEDFMRHLKLKAGLPPNYWSDSIKVFRYTAQSI